MRLLASLLLALAPGAWARLERYTPAGLEALQSKDRLILLHFTSPTCDVCRQQEYALLRVGTDPLGGMPTVVQAGTEADSELRKRLQVTAPSTLLLLRGRRELAREAGLQTEDEIRDFIHSNLSKARGRPKPRRKRAVPPRR